MDDLVAIKERVRAALGEVKLDLLMKNVRLVDVYSARVTETDIGISGEHVVSVLPSGDRQAERSLDARGSYALPGFIDAHVHIESTLLTPANLAEVIVPTGTTSLFVDPMEIANVAGRRGVEAFLSSSEDLPYRVFLQVSSRVPTAPGLETAGGELGYEDAEQMLGWPEAISLGELDPSKVLGLSEEHLRKVTAARRLGKIANGHAIGLEGSRIEAYAAAGLSDDHECVSIDQLEQRVAVGMAAMVREGSSERNLVDLISGVVERGLDTRHLMFCTDDKHPSDIRREGHINFNVNQAVQLGLTPIQAIQMATLNAALHFRIEHLIGSISPGRVADIILCDSLDRVDPSQVFVGGQLVAEQGRLVVDVPAQGFPAWLRETVHVPAEIDFGFPARGERAKLRVIEIVPDQIFNHLTTSSLPVRGGEVRPDTEEDVLKLAVVERHGMNGNVAVGWVRGFGLRRGAIACSVAHDHHNLLVVGTNEVDMLLCVREIGDNQGGFVVAEGGQVVASLSLPLAGLMSEQPSAVVESDLEQVRAAAARLGCALSTPFMTLSFISLPSIPEAGFSDRGLIDVERSELVPVLLDE